MVSIGRLQVRSSEKKTLANSVFGFQGRIVQKARLVWWQADSDWHGEQKKMKDRMRVQDDVWKNEPWKQHDPAFQSRAIMIIYTPSVLHPVGAPAKTIESRGMAGFIVELELARVRALDGH